MNTKTIYKKLVAERERLSQLSFLPESSGELNRTDHHPADMASDLTDRSHDFAATHQISQEIRRIDVAISRIRNGQYGTCIICGETIETGRLNALPDALTCHHHADDVRMHPDPDKRPVEEAVLNEWRAERRRLAAVYGIDEHAFLPADDDVHDLIIETLGPDGQIERKREEAVWAADLYGQPVQPPAASTSKPLALELDLDDFDEFSNIIADDRQVERSQFF